MVHSWQPFSENERLSSIPSEKYYSDKTINAYIFLQLLLSII